MAFGDNWDKVEFNLLGKTVRGEVVMSDSCYKDLTVEFTEKRKTVRVIAHYTNFKRIQE